MRQEETQITFAVNVGIPRVIASLTITARKQLNGFLTFLLNVFTCYSFFLHTLRLIQNAETKTDTRIKVKYQYYSSKYISTQDI